MAGLDDSGVAAKEVTVSAYLNTDYSVKPRPTPVFSLCHATIRVPDGWQAAYIDWISKADRPFDIECILSVDYDLIRHVNAANCRVVPNGRLRSSCSSYNTAASYATGRVLISVADDWFPCEHWDTALLKAIPDVEGEYAVEVRNGGAADKIRLINHAICTAAYYRRYGYLYYPAYTSMYMDNEWTEQVKRDGVLIDARHLLFPHYHPGHESYGLGRANDPVYEIESRQQAYEDGRRIFEGRWRQGQAV